MYNNPDSWFEGKPFITLNRIIYFRLLPSALNNEFTGLNYPFYISTEGPNQESDMSAVYLNTSPALNPDRPPDYQNGINGEILTFVLLQYTHYSGHRGAFHDPKIYYYCTEDNYGRSEMTNTFYIDVSTMIQAGPPHFDSSGNLIRDSEGNIIP